MHPVAIGCALGAFAGGVIVGRKHEQRVVATALAKLAAGDQRILTLVVSCYSRLSSGLKTELKKFGF
jgi:hypothetical protein